MANIYAILQRANRLIFQGKGDKAEGLINRVTSPNQKEVLRLCYEGKSCLRGEGDGK